MKSYAKDMAAQVMNLLLLSAVDTQAKYSGARTGHAATLASQSNDQNSVAQCPGLGLQAKRHRDFCKRQIRHGLPKHKLT